MGILAIAFFPFLQTFLIIQRLKDSAEIASVLSQLEIEGIPGKELCSFCTLQCARKENWENIFLFALFFLRSLPLIPVSYGGFFFCCFVFWFGLVFFLRRVIYRDCYAKIMNSLICTLSAMRGNGFSS